MQDPPFRFTGRVISANDVSADIRILRVELDNRRRLPFRAGQYVLLSDTGAEPRAFSIASPPHEPLLEFHIRNAGRGFSAHAFENLRPGAPLTVEGPLGRNILPEGENATPLLLLAGGIGIAPMKSLIETHFLAGDAAPAALYWGVRAAGQLYLDAFFRAFAARHPRFSYIPVISEAEAGETGRRTGHTGPAAAEDFDSLHGHNIYMAGPKAMIEATLPLLMQKGAEEGRVFCDAFSV